ncbi:hypothetical protein AMS68_000254 [Peltaster fructicola]|uniref:Beta-lactamase-related domain-containing protein n=1 Tax=Peltaster fructicola TaxID=286661 RepID=A0A6H0XJ32_9PEZI|nr:hypothetical protein AMS68_000254 [Peltaster fructicola]
MAKAAERVGAIADQLQPSAAKTDLERHIAAAVESSELPQCVVFATNKNGTFFKYHAGFVSKHPGARPVKEDDIFQLASQTKLVTSIAALQLVERGMIKLDDNVEHLIPELAAQPILTGFDDDDKPITKKRQNTITLRILLTHTAGCTYDGVDPLIMQWRDYHDQGPSKAGTIAERFGFPLLYEPGTKWSYGSAIDWAGLVLMRLTNKSLEEIFNENIFRPLGIKDATFFLETRPDMAARMCKISFRNEDGGLDPYDLSNINDGATECFGGQGMYASMSEYVKILHSIVKDDGKLLKPETRKIMFEPQLNENLEKSLKHVMRGPTGAYFVGEYDLNLPANWGIGGLLFMADDAGRRKKYTLQWSGMPNTYWIIDPTAELALVFGTQVLMPGDRTVAKNITAVEKGVYKIAGVHMP